MSAPDPPRSSRRIYVYWGIALSTLLALGLVCWLVVRPRFARATGLHCLLTVAERYHGFSGIHLPPSAEIVSEECEKWVFLDPQYRLVFRVSEQDAQGLISSHPPWAQGEWKEGVRVRPPFGKPLRTGEEGTYAVFGTHGTWVFQGFNVDLKKNIVEFVYSEM